MQQQKVIAAYNLTADAYAAQMFDELAHKPLDRMLLSQFAAENKLKGKMIDLGCGPGQTTRFLAGKGVHDILGTDISPAMLAKARQLNPGLQFEFADMLELQFPEATFASAIAFYAIVHFNTEELKTAFAEINRVLTSGGQFLFSFHVGNEVFHRDDLFGQAVDIDYYFSNTDVVISLLNETGFKIIDAIERYAYPDLEYACKLAYLWVAKA